MLGCILQEGMSFKGKYTMQSHGWQAPAYVLCSGHRTADRRLPMSVKLFARGMDYLQEKALLETPTITLQQYLPGSKLLLSLCVWVLCLVVVLLQLTDPELCQLSAPACTVVRLTSCTFFLPVMRGVMGNVTCRFSTFKLLSAM